MAEGCPTCAMMRGILMGANPTAVKRYDDARDVLQTLERVAPATTKKVKRKVSKYSREFGRQLKSLKRKHPRTRVSDLMSKAHKATKKVLK